jgi:protease IV
LVWRSLAGFFRLIWRILDGLRRGVHLLLMLVLLAVLIAVLGSRPTRLPDAFVLLVRPEGLLVEQYSGDPVERALDASRGFLRSQSLVSDLADAIDEAAGDDRVKAIHLQVDHLAGGSADKLDRITAALERFNASGKPVIASGTMLALPQYYLAAHAGEFYLDPLGGVLLQGFGFYRNYYKDALDKLTVDWYVFRAGEAKSYGDAFIRNSMSEEERSNLGRIVEGLWANWRAGIAQTRGLEPGLLDDYIERLVPRMRAAGGDSAQAALDAGLVDGIRSVAEIEQRLAETGGRDAEGDYVAVGAEDYLAAIRAREASVAAVSGTQSPSVGLIVASGDILPGDQPAGVIGDESLRALLHEARNNDAVRALVLRVDSGGGSQFASEAIMRELEVLRASGKPLIVSMGGMAASGGYIISLPADEIWAHPTTVTGSIGVVAMMSNFGRLLQRLGVTVDGVGTHPLSGEFRLDREFGPEAKEFIELLVAGGYERFLGQVAEARGMPVEDVLEVAEGRVWLGDAALELGLVDRLGTLDEALAAAADLAGLEVFEVMLFEQDLSLSERVMVSLLSGATRLGFAAWPRSLLDRLPVEVRNLFTELERLDGFADPRGLYYHCFCEAR